MSFLVIITISVLLAVLSLLALTRRSPEMILLGGLGVLLVTGVLSPNQALAGFSNEGMITIGALFVVSAGLRETGGIWLIAGRLLGRSKSLMASQVRIVFAAAVSSAFLNNTPLVAMLMPAIRDWAKKNNLPLSKLLIPLSYSAILGGLCTLIGTSTNLIVNGLLLETGHPSLGMFDITAVGLPCALAGTIFILLTGKWLLPDRTPAMRQVEDPREYTVEMMVEENSPLVNQTIEEAGLRNLSGMYLMEIERDQEILAAVGSRERLLANDRLVFVGIVESVVELQKIRGLKPATNQLFKLEAHRSKRCLIEAVVSNTHPLVGKTIKEGRFRSLYMAAVIAVARNGERVNKKIGDIRLRPGDTLILEALPEFVDKQRNSRDFYLVSRLEDSQPPRYEKAYLSVAILAVMVVVVALGWLSMLKAGILAAGLMFLTGCLSGEMLRKSLDARLLLAISAALGIGKAMEVSGVAHGVAGYFFKLAGGSPWLTLLVVYLVTMVFTEVITNNAAAVLMFPFAKASALALDVNFMPFVITIMIAASASFATPIGYQTNLMVYGPGGYRYTDFLKAGLPLGALICIITVTLVPLLWPF